jgi:hypothetical protein
MTHSWTVFHPELGSGRGHADGLRASGLPVKALAAFEASPIMER